MTFDHHTLLRLLLIIGFIVPLLSITFAQTPTAEESDPETSPENSDEELLSKLRLNGLAFSPGLVAAIPPTIITVETPIAVRYVMLVTTAGYQVYAACDPIALSFFATKDPIDPDLCDPVPFHVTIYQLIYNILRPEFPQEAFGIAQFLTSLGFNAFDEDAPIDTPIGWANANSIALREYFDNDGWNALGDETKQYYRFPFQDTSGYLPQNNPFTSPMDLPRPLRWQPLPFTDFRGRFGHQIHVVPHIGINAKPIALSMEDFESRKAPSPYKFPNMSMEIDVEDDRTVRERIEKLFEQTRTLNDDRIGLAYFWENKFFSLGSFIGFYEAALGVEPKNFTPEELSFTLVGVFAEMIAQHDAVLVAWKEKRRHDLVRPTTMIRRLLSGKMVNAYRGIGLGNGMISADEWEPILPVQPHSEYPSGSAVICQASLERLQIQLEEVVGPNGTIPPYRVPLPAGSIPRIPIANNFTFSFGSLKEAALSCGESRLYGGVHFEPSVIEGLKLGEGIGKASAEHVKDLVEGRVPKNCMRCKTV